MMRKPELAAVVWYYVGPPILFLLLIVAAVTAEGCAIVEGAKKLLDRMEVCVEVGGTTVCFRLDMDGDGELETHCTIDENANPHAPADEPGGDDASRAADTPAAEPGPVLSLEDDAKEEH